MKYTGLSLKEVWHKLPMSQGWALLSAGIECDSSIMVKRAGKGYIAQEIDRLMELVKKEK